MVGDGFCNDEANNAECNYDGGDCCVNVNTTFCSECTCHYQENCAAGLILSCLYHERCLAGFIPPMVGDGICNDETNHQDCNYDGGDCCLSSSNLNECSECICYHKETCVAGFLPSSVGDGFCNYETNNNQCYYDGLDCCVFPDDTTFCSNCSCHGELIFFQKLQIVTIDSGLVLPQNCQVPKFLS